MAWEYWQRNGAVTGGGYNTTDTCLPYTIQPCEHHTNGTLPPCSGESPTPQCPRTRCQFGGKERWQNETHLFRGQRSYQVQRDEKQIQTELFNSGPVEAAFTGI